MTEIYAGEVMEATTYEATARMTGEVGGIRRAVAVVVVGAVALGGATWAAIRGGGDSRPTTSHPTEWLDVAGQEHPSCVSLVDAIDAGGTYKFDGKELVTSKVGAFQPGRLWGNSMRAPFKTNDPEAEAKAGFCEDTPFSVATAWTVGNVNYKGMRLADTKDGAWLKPYADLAQEDLNDKAAYLLGADLKPNQVRKHQARYDERIQLAENLAAVISNLHNDGLKTGATLTDVSYDAQSFVGVTGIPEMVVSLAQFKDAEALMFGVTLKGETCETPIIGFNTGIGANGFAWDGDQRPETFVSEDCLPPPETPHTPPTTGGTPTTTRPHGSTTTTRPHGSTTTTSRPVGPKHNPHPPVEGGPTTTVPAPVEGPPIPTTNTTTPPTTLPPHTIPGTTPTSTPPVTQPARPELRNKENI